MHINGKGTVQFYVCSCESLLFIFGLFKQLVIYDDCFHILFNFSVKDVQQLEYYNSFAIIKTILFNTHPLMKLIYFS